MMTAESKILLWLCFCALLNSKYYLWFVKIIKECFIFRYFNVILWKNIIIWRFEKQSFVLGFLSNWIIYKFRWFFYTQLLYSSIFSLYFEGHCVRKKCSKLTYLDRVEMIWISLFKNNFWISILMRRIGSCFQIWVPFHIHLMLTWLLWLYLANMENSGMISFG